MPSCAAATTIMPNIIDPITVAVQTESAVCKLIEEYRRDNFQEDTVWDEQLSNCLSPALAAYESQCPLSSVFQQGIKNIVPIHFSFKAYPCQFDHTNPVR
uniref:Centrosomal protein of 76 kDa C-terminal domain-containing protein n=1 Tax=Spongospora subterranea TaxID=70186 RepID=A0A0H5R748_9EUKA|eukprot:CRZ09577.1 hypothetical protein [Spongospora subterranea]